MYLHKKIEKKRLGSLFEPLTLLKEADLVIEGSNEQLLENAKIQVEMNTQPGVYEIPISFGKPFKLKFPEGCTISGHINIEPSLDANHGEPLIRDLKFVLDPPVIFEDVLVALKEVNKVFNDEKITALLARFSTSLADKWPLTQKLQAFDFHSFSQQVLTEKMDDLAKVMLEKIEARAEQIEGNSQLVFRFTGKIKYFDKLTFPFFRFRLPTFILPTLHASLENFISKNPLASASFLEDQLSFKLLSKRMLKPIAGFKGSLEGYASLPSMQLGAELIFKSLLSVQGNHDQKMKISGHFSGSREGDYFNVQLKAMAQDLNQKTLKIEVTGLVDPDSLIDEDWEDGIADLSLKKPQDAQGKVLSGLNINIAESSVIDKLQTTICLTHPLVKGKIELPLLIENLDVSGKGQVALETGKNIASQGGDLRFTFMTHLVEGVVQEDSFNQWFSKIRGGHIKGRALWQNENEIQLMLEGSLPLNLSGKSKINAIPELSIKEGAVLSEIAGKLKIKASARLSRSAEGLAQLELKDCSFSLQLKKAQFQLEERRITFPTNTLVHLEIMKGAIDTSGIGQLQLKINWDLKDQLPLLHTPEKDLPLILEELKQSELILHLNSMGSLSIEGKTEGIFNAKLFNALLNPHADLQKLNRVLNSTKAVDHFLTLLDEFSPKWAKKLKKLHKEYKKYKRILKEEGVEEPKDMLSNQDMARVASKLLNETKELEERLRPIIKQVTDGEGLNRYELKHIINELHPNHPYGFELDRILRWVDHLFSPGEPLPPPEITKDPPLVKNALYRAYLKEIPSAGEIYEVLQGKKKAPDGFFSEMARIAPYLTLEQMDYILRNINHAEWKTRDINRLQYIWEIKKRIRMVAEGTGDIRYVFLPVVIGFFIGEITEIKTALVAKASSDEVPVGFWDREWNLHTDGHFLGPEDVAILLRAGLAWPWQSLMVQINQRLLLNYSLSRSADFLYEVLTEMSEKSSKVLTGILIALLKQEQDHLKEPLELVDIFSQQLGIECPRLEDYMAGGKRADESYYSANLHVADYIIENSSRYLARKDHLQVQRFLPDRPFKETQKTMNFVQKAQAAIKKADELGQQCTFLNSKTGPYKNAIQAYEEAFQACAELLQKDKTVITVPWFKSFWQRNYEALVVLSVVRNYQENLENVRNWLHVRSGQTQFRDEQHLLETIIEVLYYFETERTLLKKDPLVRLLIDPPAGKYDFTIVSCMGLITEGTKGTELDSTLQRLKNVRGLKVIKADTGTFKTLEHNSRKVEAILSKVKTPWGFLGYSQGCANSLKTESLLKGGTPEQQKMLAGFRCRNLMFGAHNGSAHGSCGDLKFRHALIKGERFIKHYQGRASSWAIDTYFRMLNLVLDSQFFIQLIGGTESVSHEVCVALARDGQFCGHIPTSTIRGVVFPEILPEATEMISNMLTYQTDGALHDTQVTLVSTRGYSNRVENDYTRVLENCDMGSYPQSSHHWSPLVEEVEFVTTARDRELAIYDFPQDRHLFPWIEVNARFGVIEPLEEGKRIIF
ncbi:hypothetical protein WDW89_03695 [Deltaproteobacteria bacterium TL4]